MPAHCGAAHQQAGHNVYPQQVVQMWDKHEVLPFEIDMAKFHTKAGWYSAREDSEWSLVSKESHALKAPILVTTVAQHKSISFEVLAFLERNDS